ncbi:MAG: ABC transporter ATP-binding protein [Candidatus Kapaibacterium sp.]
MTNIIKAKDLHKSFSIKSGKTVRVLSGINIDFNKGEFTAITGPSGAGKSTLLYVLSSIDLPDKGSVEVNINGDTADFRKLSEKKLAKFRNEHIGFIFQFHHLLPEFTALENVMFPSLIAGKSKKESKAKAKELIGAVGMSDRAEHKPSELSGGEQQRIAIARALINDPGLVFADEPTGNLDSKSSGAVLDIISEMQQKTGSTFIVATHSASVASVARRRLHIEDGRISELDV